jgi:hypothetical protein
MELTLEEPFSGPGLGPLRSDSADGVCAISPLMDSPDGVWKLAAQDSLLTVRKRTRALLNFPA